MTMAKDPSVVAAKWANGLAQAGPAMQAGVEGVAMAPGQAAARQKEAWAQNTAAAKDKWASNTAKVSLQDWQAAMITKGVPRIAQGAQASESKFATFMSELLPAIDRVKATLPPRGNLEQNLTRANQFARGMAKFSKS